jgi:hypothetical protein
MRLKIYSSRRAKGGILKRLKFISLTAIMLSTSACAQEFVPEFDYYPGMHIKEFTAQPHVKEFFANPGINDETTSGTGTHRPFFLNIHLPNGVYRIDYHSGGGSYFLWGEPGLTLDSVSLAVERNKDFEYAYTIAQNHCAGLKEKMGALAHVETINEKPDPVDYLKKELRTEMRICSFVSNKMYKSGYVVTSVYVRWSRHRENSFVVYIGARNIRDQMFIQEYNKIFGGKI